MFTGLIEEVGTVKEVVPNSDGARFSFNAKVVLGDVALGDSIAVNGCCLTVVDFDTEAGWWSADAVTETMRRTALGVLTPGDPINLERPLRVGDRLGGHIVQGHVDGTATVSRRDPLPDGSVHLSFDIDPSLMAYIVEKGSIALSGVSLTVAGRTGAGCSVAVIPHTQTATTLGTLQVGDTVNVEVDVVSKYVRQFVHLPPESS